MNAKTQSKTYWYHRQYTEGRRDFRIIPSAQTGLFLIFAIISGTNFGLFGIAGIHNWVHPVFNWAIMLASLAFFIYAMVYKTDYAKPKPHNST